MKVFIDCSTRTFIPSIHSRTPYKWIFPYFPKFLPQFWGNLFQSKFSIRNCKFFIDFIKTFEFFSGVRGLRSPDPLCGEPSYKASLGGSGSSPKIPASAIDIQIINHSIILALYLQSSMSIPVRSQDSASPTQKVDFCKTCIHTYHSALPLLSWAIKR